MDKFALAGAVFSGVLLVVKSLYQYKLQVLSREIYEKKEEKVIAAYEELEKCTNNTSSLLKSIRLKEKLDQLLEPELKTNNKSNIIPRICLTGGPCAGKTSGLAYVSERLRERGFGVYIVPEAATQIGIGGGLLNMTDWSDDIVILFQINLMRLQIALENTFQTLASLQKEKKCVILCDRGLMDGKAYMSSDLWKTMLDRYQLDEVDLRDKRYDLVIHMVTAAEGTDHYSTMNNVTRHETKDVAIRMDHLTQQAWIGHPNYIKIDNHSVQTFEEKLHWLVQEVGKTLGIPFDSIHKHNMKMFLLGLQKFENLTADIEELTLTTSIFEIHYLKSDKPDVFTKICKMQQSGQSIFLVKEKHFKEGKLVQSFYKYILKKEYEQQLAAKIDPNREKIYKTRTSFSYLGQYMIVDQYTNMNPFTAVLRIKNCYAQIMFPPFLKVVREIREPEKLKSRYLSQNTEYLCEINKSMKFRKMSNQSQENKITYLVNMIQLVLPPKLEVQILDITVTYLQSLLTNLSKKIKFIQNKQQTPKYYYQETLFLNNQKQCESKEISKEEYKIHLENRDKNSISIRKKKISFNYLEQDMILTIYKITPQVLKLTVLNQKSTKQLQLPSSVQLLRKLGPQEKVNCRTLNQQIEHLIKIQTENTPQSKKRPESPDPLWPLQNSSKNITTAVKQTQEGQDILNSLTDLQYFYFEIAKDQLIDLGVDLTTREKTIAQNSNGKLVMEKSADKILYKLNGKIINEQQYQEEALLAKTFTKKIIINFVYLAQAMKVTRYQNRTILKSQSKQPTLPFKIVETVKKPTDFN